MAKKEITKKEHIVIVLLLIFRFVNSKQIQEFLGHTDHRRINAWLKDLVEKGYIERDFIPIYGNTHQTSSLYPLNKGPEVYASRISVSLSGILETYFQGCESLQILSHPVPNCSRLVSNAVSTTPPA